MKKLLSILLFTCLTVSGFSQSFYTETGTAIFYSKVPLHNFSGTSNSLIGLINFDDSTVDFYIDLETLDTKNAKRDKDMKLTLDTENYPYGEFFGKLTSEFDLESTAEQEVMVEGVFKIHGKEKEIIVEGTLRRDGENLYLKAGWILLLEDYEIVPPQILFIKVDQEQEIEINATLTIKE
tara:strand:+ start:12802 stop:13341 length:540 start_codon:yes stop_codon:yes gene_type:complete